MVRKRSYSDDDLKHAVITASTMAETLRILGLTVRAGNYSSVKRHISRLKLDTSHWNPEAAQLRGLQKAREKNTIPLEDILVKNSSYTSGFSLKRRLLRAGLLENKCAFCDITTWRDKPLMLQIDHKNGIHDDNRLSNIRLLCPNCHSQTATFCGRNKSIAGKRFGTSKEKVPCSECNVSFKHRGSARCTVCANKRRLKICWPPIQELVDEVQTTSYSAVARKLGVSDNAIRKRLEKQLGFVPKRTP